MNDREVLAGNDDLIQAVLELFGVEVDLYRNVTIVIPYDGLVTITVERLVDAERMEKQMEVVEE